MFGTAPVEAVRASTDRKAAALIASGAIAWGWSVRPSSTVLKQVIREYSTVALISVDECLL